MFFQIIVHNMDTTSVDNHSLQYTDPILAFEKYFWRLKVHFYFETKQKYRFHKRNYLFFTSGKPGIFNFRNHSILL